MIKAYLKEVEKPNFSYPVMAKSIGKSVPKIVLFDTECSGIPLWSGSGNRAFTYHDTWVSVLDETAWQILPKGFQITLVQE